MREKETVHVDVMDSIATITMDRPPVNALSLSLLQELEGALEGASKAGCRVVILTGAAGVFSAGADLKDLAQGELMENQAFFHRVYETFSRVEEFGLPVVAAVEGFALGAGMELALCCDIRVMAENARLGATGVNIGLVFCTQRLPRLIGYGRAKGLLLTGRFVGASEACQIGLVHEVAPEGKALPRAEEVARLLVSKSGSAQAAVKAVLRDGAALSLKEALALEEEYMKKALDGHDFKERVGSFLAGGKSKA